MRLEALAPAPVGIARTRRFIFVLEQTLGHRAHSQNLERALANEEWIDPTILRVGYRPRNGVERLPGLGSWTVRASRDVRGALRRRMDAGPADAIFIHTQVAAQFSAGLMGRVPAVVSLDATPINVDAEGAAYGHAPEGRLREDLKRALNRRAFGAAQALVTWNRWARDSLVEDYAVSPAKIRVIRPGVDLDLFRPGGPRAHRDRVRLLFVGGDFERKGGLDLFAAALPLAHRVELDIVTSPGAPEPPPGLRCHFHHGLRPQSRELVELYRQADMFVLPSRGDCLPQAIAEAQACGLPVVATRVGAVPEVVVHGSNGLLVPRGAPDLLSEAIGELVERPWLRWELGARGLELARAEHDATRNNHAIFDLLEEVSS